jgi:hypothetical protein
MRPPPFLLVTPHTPGLLRYWCHVSRFTLLHCPTQCTSSSPTQASGSGLRGKRSHGCGTRRCTHDSVTQTHKHTHTHTHTHTGARTHAEPHAAHSPRCGLTSAARCGFSRGSYRHSPHPSPRSGTFSSASLDRARTHDPRVRHSDTCTLLQPPPGGKGFLGGRSGWAGQQSVARVRLSFSYSHTQTHTTATREAPPPREPYDNCRTALTSYTAPRRVWRLQSTDISQLSRQAHVRMCMARTCTTCTATVLCHLPVHVTTQPRIAPWASYS